MRPAIVTFCAATLLAAPARADITVEVFQGKSVLAKENGMAVERVFAVDTVVPGETVIYRYTVRNEADRPADDVVVNAIVPDHTTYVPNSARAKGWNVVVSSDGTSHAREGELVIYEIDETTRPAEPGDIRYLRWKLTGQMPPRSAGTIEFRTVLNR